MQTLQQAISAHQAGKLDEACALYSKATLENLENADLHHLYGMALFRKGEIAPAERLMRKALALSPCFPIALYNLASLLLEAGRKEEALHCLRRSVLCDPLLTPAQFAYNSLLIDLERVQDAIASLKVAICYNPAEFTLWLKLCGAYFVRRQMPQTERATQIAERLNPSDPAAPALRGRLRLEAGDFEEACRLLSHAAECAPSDLLVQAHLAQAEALSGRKHQALERGWRTVNLAFTERPKVLLDPLPSDAIFDRIDAAIPPELPREGSLVYPFNRTGLIGHVWVEPSYIRNIFANRYQHIILVGPPLHKSPRMSREVFEISMRGVTYVECEDLPVTALAFSDIGTFERNGRTYLLHGHRHTERLFGQHFATSGVRHRTPVPDMVRERGEAFCRRFDIPTDAPLVVIHMREPGYHAKFSSLFSMRDVTVANYIDSIRYLKKQGYWVVRLGDPSMTPLPEMGREVCDVAFAPDYDRVNDIYFIDRCEFMISSGSGLEEIARAIGRPNLVMNVPMFYNIFGTGPCDLFAFRRCIDTSKAGRHLMTFGEMIDRGVPDADTTAKANQKDILFEELTAPEMLAVTREMTKVVRMREPATETTAQFRRLARQGHEQRRNDRGLLHVYSDYFAHGLARPLLSDEFAFFNDHFLDG